MIKGFEKDCYLSDLSKIPWDSAYIYDDIDDIYHHWHHLFIKVVDQHLPFKRKYIRGNQLPGITLEISSAILRRNILFRKFKRNKSDDNWEQFKKQRNLVTALKPQSMKSCFIQASAECAHPGEFRKEFKPLLPSKVLNNNIYDFQHFKQTFYRWRCCSYSCLSSHAFANHFIVNKISQRCNHLQFSIRHVEEGYVKKLINTLDPRKATGPDKMSPRILTVSSVALAVSLTSLINHCITINAWP